MREYIKKHIFNSKNVTLFFIIFITYVILQCCISTCIIFLKFQDNLYNKNQRFRTIVVKNLNDNDYYELLNNNKIVTIKDSIYKNPYDINVEEFNKNNLKGYISLKPVLDKKIFIKTGKKIEDNDETVCSYNLYPYDFSDFNVKNYKENILKSNKIINKKFNVKSDNDDSIFSLTIVGTFDNYNTGDTINTCYVSNDLFSKVASNYKGGISYIDENTGENIFIENIDDEKIIIVNKYENLNDVLDYLNKHNINNYLLSELDEGYMKLFTDTPIFFASIICLLFIVILEKYYKKKNIYKAKDYALLKAIGYSKKKIVLIDIIENFMISIISLIMSSITYIIVYRIIMNTFLFELIYDGIKINFSYLPFILSFVTVSIITLFICFKTINKNFEKNISEVLR